MPKTDIVASVSEWMATLGAIAAAVAAEIGVAAPVAATVTAAAQAAATALLRGERKAVLLGNAAAHHAQADALLALVNFIATQTGASVGYLTEAANTVGAQWVGAMPQAQGKNAAQIVQGAAAGLKAVILLNNEPEFDSAAAQGVEADMVVTLSPFKANLAFSDVLLPIAPFSETAGTFVNAEGRAQSFHAVVKPLGETRPAWKVLRVLGNILGMNEHAFAADTAEQVLAQTGLRVGERVGTRYDNSAMAAPSAQTVATVATPCTASIYQLDGIVRRAPSLQATRDGQLKTEGARA